MNISRLFAPIALVALVSLGACERKAESTPASRPSPNTAPVPSDASRKDATPPAPATPAPDNTAKNNADASGATKTPMDQSEASADIRITADIRRAIMNDKAMSMNAQNCKIITDKAGVVTLRGVVNSQAERDSIEAKAKAVAGVSKVDNQLEVKSS